MSNSHVNACQHQGCNRGSYSLAIYFFFADVISENCQQLISLDLYGSAGLVPFYKLEIDSRGSIVLFAHAISPFN